MRAMRTPCPVTPMKRVRPSSRALASASTAPPGRAPSPTRRARPGCGAGSRSTWSTCSRSSDRSSSARAASPVRSPVLVARKNSCRCSAHPRPDAQLRVAVAGGGVDVVDAVAQQRGQHLVGPLLAHRRQPGGAEDHAGAVVSGAAERCGREMGKRPSRELTPDAGAFRAAMAARLITTSSEVRRRPSHRVDKVRSSVRCRPVENGVLPATHAPEADMTGQILPFPPASPPPRRRRRTSRRPAEARRRRAARRHHAVGACPVRPAAPVRP